MEDFFDRHKALIITILFIMVVFLGLYNFGLSQSNQKERELLVDLENFRTEEPEIPLEEKEEAPQKNVQQNVQTHRAFNENEAAREENFDAQLDEIFQKNSAQQAESTPTETSGSSGNYAVKSKPKQTTRKQSDGNNSSTATSTQKGSIGNSSITFSLVGRTAVDIPNPIYTCDRQGKVVVNITVDANGRVLTTSINKGSSTTSNECLTQQALEYASLAVFSNLQGRNSQPGTITYQFKP